MRTLYANLYLGRDTGLYSLIPATPGNLQPRYNIAPTARVGVVTQAGNALTYSKMRWSLIPSWWSKDLNGVPATFNARAEDIKQNLCSEQLSNGPVALFLQAVFFWSCRKARKCDRKKLQISASGSMPNRANENFRRPHAAITTPL